MSDVVNDSDDEVLDHFNELDSDGLIDILPIVILIIAFFGKKRKRLDYERSYSMIEKIPHQVKLLTRLIGVNDAQCVANLRMDRNTFGRLVLLLRDLGGLVDGKYVTVEEQVATFLGIIAHHKKNRVVGFNLWRSGETVSRYMNSVLQSILLLHGLFLVKPDPVPANCNDPRWKWFKGCLGALDGTYIDVNVATADKPRYRTRKGQISTNTLAVCDRHLRFVYVLPGWEGSAADSRVLRDAVCRANGLRVLRGNYYLADNGYANSEGFLTPYRGVRYHLKEWGAENQMPVNPHELFNMRHSKARNVIERAFGIMKMRWGILRSASYYPLKTQTKLIGACFLLHNFIRTQMVVDPVEEELDTQGTDDEAVHVEDDLEYVDNVESTTAWGEFREEIANHMWQTRQAL